LYCKCASIVSRSCTLSIGAPYSSSRRCDCIS
jgi:hypothetical protein